MPVEMSTRPLPDVRRSSYTSRSSPVQQGARTRQATHDAKTAYDTRTLTPVHDTRKCGPTKSPGPITLMRSQSGLHVPNQDCTCPDLVSVACRVGWVPTE